MDGSPLVFILMLIVPTPLLVGWLAVVFYVGSHPGHRTQSAASEDATRNSPLVPLLPLPRAAPAEPAHRNGSVPLLLPGPAYSRQLPETTADPGRVAPPHGDAERPAA
jgi:hypothetical protein